MRTSWRLTQIPAAPLQQQCITQHASHTQHVDPPSATCALTHPRPQPPAPSPTCALTHLRPHPPAPSTTCALTHLRPQPPAPSTTCALTHLRPHPPAPSPTCALTHLRPHPPAPAHSHVNLQRGSRGLIDICVDNFTAPGCRELAELLAAFAWKELSPELLASADLLIAMAALAATRVAQEAQWRVLLRCASTLHDARMYHVTQHGTPTRLGWSDMVADYGDAQEWLMAELGRAARRLLGLLPQQQQGQRQQQQASQQQQQLEALDDLYSCLVLFGPVFQSDEAATPGVLTFGQACRMELPRLLQHLPLLPPCEVLVKVSYSVMQMMQVPLAAAKSEQELLYGAQLYVPGLKSQLQVGSCLPARSLPRAHASANLLCPAVAIGMW
jgi:hypothetical protein